MEELFEQLDELKRQIEAMRRGEDLELMENLRRRALQDIVSAGTIDDPDTENESTVIGVGGGTVDHAEEYDKRVRVTIDGTDYYIGLYNV